VITAKFNCDGSQLATCSLDNTMNIYTTTPPSTSSTSNPSPSFTFLHKLEGPSEEILFLHWHHTHAMILLCGGYDKLIWMLNTSTGTILNAFSCHSDIISDGGFTPSGKAIYSSSHDNTLHITHPSTGKFKTINSIKPLRGVINTCLCDISRFLIIAATTQGSLFFANYQTLKVIYKNLCGGALCVFFFGFFEGFWFFFGFFWFFMVLGAC
jgi:WD40 repeat protein